MENQIQNRQKIHRAMLVFVDPAPTAEAHEVSEAIQALTEARDWARLHHFIDDENEALWGLARAYASLDRRPKAIETLQSLRTNLETARRQIRDVRRRANILNAYPRLFPQLCQWLYEAGRYDELLNVIEAAKGRVLAEVLLPPRGQPAADSTATEPAVQVPALLGQVGAHYLSYLVTETHTYAVLVTQNGSFHAAAIPLGADRLRAWAKQINPVYWRVSRAGLFGSAALPPEQLSPLVQWLAPLFESSVLKTGDHLCYCPDDVLHLVPLHYLTFCGKPLVQQLSLSRIQSAGALLALLGHTPQRPQQFRAVQVPDQQDRTDAEKLSQLGRVPAWLAAHLDGEVHAGVQADLNTLSSQRWTHRVVHFATHGTFPDKDEPGRDPNPYRASGLLLAHAGQLPSGTAIAHGETAPLLTPEKVLALDFSGSQITLQACVSGLAKEGIGGDALGLEWAFLQAGAQSLLATHWNVPDFASADFSIGFYEQWLVQGRSRAAAWRATVLELMEKPYDDRRPQAYLWAAFSLSGDWR